jgi:hypothetical protein
MGTVEDGHDKLTISPAINRGTNAWRDSPEGEYLDSYSCGMLNCHHHMYLLEIVRK